MKNLKLLVFYLLISTNLFAQFKTISIKKSDVPQLKIVQIDFREFSTFISFQLINMTAGSWACINDNVYIIDNSTSKKYKLLNSINLPICDKKQILDELYQKHNFILEFEKIPETINDFDIIENAEGGFNFNGISIDTSKREKDFIDISSFTKETPVKEYGYFYKDGSPVLYYKHNGLMIAVMLTLDNTYGTYYQPNILIQNLTGKDINFDPTLITAKTVKKGETTEAKVLTYQEYMKKVKSRQAWNSFAVALSESTAASKAGYSSSSTQNITRNYSNSYGSASGYVGNTYGSIYGNSTTYSTSYGSSTTKSYNAAAAYAAQQNANNNIASNEEQQFQIRKTISEGYMKLNTIFNGSEFVGYVNILYNKAERLHLIIPMNETFYTFIW